MAEIRRFFDSHKPKSTPGIIDLALSKVPQGSGVAIDLCCGSGTLIGKLADRGYRTCGVDISTRYIGTSNRDSGTFVIADVAIELPFKSNSAVLTCCIDSLQYFHKPDAVLEEMARLLQPGGTLLLSTQNNYNLVGVKRLIIEALTRRTWSPWTAHPIENHITYPWLIKTLERSGFQIDYVRGRQFLTALVALLPYFVRNWSPWKDKPWRSLSGIAQRVALPGFIEESFLRRFSMIVFVQARKR